MDFESGIFQNIVFTFQHIIDCGALDRCLEQRRFFQFELVGHVLTLNFKHTIGIIARDIPVKHVFITPL